MSSSCTLVLNGGSSSIKFALYRGTTRVAHGQMERIEQPHCRIVCSHDATNAKLVETFESTVYRLRACELMASWIEEHLLAADASLVLTATGHRVVHGFTFTEPMRVDDALLAKLTELIPFAQEHLPLEIALMRTFLRRHADIAHVACFDTAFHQSMPHVATMLPIPRRYFDAGVRRYGFHGLSYTYLMKELASANQASGRIVLCHLGNGASMAAVLDGKCIDTTMSFSPTAGLVMGTRCGDIDPAVVMYMQTNEHKSIDEIRRLLNHDSGMIGISGGLSSDMRDLLRLRDEEASEPARDAVAAFVYNARKFIAALASALGGLDTVVFSGGIGENSNIVRREICSQLGFLGVELDDSLNDANAPRIDSQRKSVAVRIIRTDEERTILDQVTVETLRR